MQRFCLVLGISTKIILPAFLIQGLMGLLTAFGPDGLLIPRVNGPSLEIIGLLSIASGCFLLLKGWRDLETRFFEGVLVDPAVFASVRKPVYAGWLIFILPGLPVVFRAWPMFIGSASAWLLYRAYASKVETNLWHILFYAWKYHLFKNRWFPDTNRREGELPF